MWLLRLGHKVPRTSTLLSWNPQPWNSAIMLWQSPRKPQRDPCGEDSRPLTDKPSWVLSQQSPLTEPPWKWLLHATIKLPHLMLHGAKMSYSHRALHKEQNCEQNTWLLLFWAITICSDLLCKHQQLIGNLIPKNGCCHNKNLKQVVWMWGCSSGWKLEGAWEDLVKS